jgi:nucleotide-binding universal stress UspA family protein
MFELKNILVATDFSPGSHLALQHAIDLANATHAEMHIVFAEVLHGDPYDEGVRTRLHHLVDEQLKLRHGEGLKINYAIERDFAAAPAILRYADDKKVDLIVMGTHGRRGLRRLMLGSVAQEVVRLAPSPVLTVRGYDEKESTIQPIRSILVPIDFSDYSKSALAVARELAVLFEARMDVFHIVEDTFHPAFYGPFFQSVYDVEPRIEEKSKEHLKSVIEEVGGPDVEHTVDSFKKIPI